MTEKYFAGYSTDTKFADPVSIINESQLRKILIDSDDSITIASGSVLTLEEGYELRIKQIDLDGNKVYVALAKTEKRWTARLSRPPPMRQMRARITYTYVFSYPKIDR